jgi:hypothetical protein
MSELLCAKGARWFQRYGPCTRYAEGFKSKADASAYINAKPDLDWRAGFVFRLYGDEHDRSIVNRKGEVAKI